MRCLHRPIPVLLAGFMLAPASFADRLRLAWPTANDAYAVGQPLADYIQPTVSGKVESGLYGCVRSGGRQFHEGLDLKALHRDRHGEATDEVFAVLGGVVRYINAKPGLSSYGRYVVIEHVASRLPVTTLYAHLASVTPGLVAGAEVQTGQVIGVMGRSAGSRALPQDRAHLHFEIGLRLADDFQAWYDWKQFGNPNDHGLWNGLNLTGIDPQAFYDAFRARQVDDFAQYWRTLEPTVIVRVATRNQPDFVRRYAALLSSPVPPEEVAGWEVAFDRYAVPLAWTPLPAAAVSGFEAGEVRVVTTDAAELAAAPCRALVITRPGGTVPGVDLQRNLQLLFGIRP